MHGGRGLCKRGERVVVSLSVGPAAAVSGQGDPRVRSLPDVLALAVSPANLAATGAPTAQPGT